MAVQKFKRYKKGSWPSASDMNSLRETVEQQSRFTTGGQGAEGITGDFEPGGYEADLPARITGVTFVDLKILTGGSSYAPGDLLAVASGTGIATTTIKVISINVGAITDAVVVYPGYYSDYPTNPVPVTPITGTGIGATFALTFLKRPTYSCALINENPNTFVLNGWQVNNGGTGYSVNDVLIVSGGDGVSPATLKVAVAAGGIISAVTILFSGQYVLIPSNPVSVTGGTGSGAKFDLTFAGSPTNKNSDDFYFQGDYQTDQVGYQAYERSNNPYVPTDGSVMVVLKKGLAGSYMEFDSPRISFIAALTGSSGNAYSWVELFPVDGPPSGWTYFPPDCGGLQGGVTLNPAYNYNGISGLPNQIVRMFPAYSGGYANAQVAIVQHGGSVNQVQSLTLINNNGGSFTLSFDNTVNNSNFQTTTSLVFNADAAAVLAALNALTGGPSVNTVTGSGSVADPFLITFFATTDYLPIVPNYQGTLFGDNKFVFETDASLVGGGGRIILNTNTTYYVATTGSDSNPGTLASPWLTIQHAADVVFNKTDLAGYNVLVQIEDGTGYAGATITAPQVGEGTITFQGNVSTPGNVVINGSIDVSNGAAITVQYMDIGSTGFALYVLSGGNIVVGNGIRFLPAVVHMFFQTGGTIAVIGSYEIIGRATQAHLSGNLGGVISFNPAGVTITISVGYAFGIFCQCNVFACVDAVPLTITGAGVASCTGQRFQAQYGGVIYTNTNNLNFFPGDAPGSIVPWGVYDQFGGGGVIEFFDGTTHVDFTGQLLGYTASGPFVFMDNMSTVMGTNNYHVGLFNTVGDAFGATANEAIGNSNTLNNNGSGFSQSGIFGNSNNVQGNNCYAYGFGNNQSGGSYCTVVGTLNMTSGGNQSGIFGYDNTNVGQDNTIVGLSNTLNAVSNGNSTMIGNSLSATMDNSFIAGYSLTGMAQVSNGYNIIIGFQSSVFTADYSICLGFGNGMTATNGNNVLIGSDSTVNGNNCTAIGPGVQVTQVSNGHTSAIGYNLQATMDDSFIAGGSPASLNQQVSAGFNTIVGQRLAHTADYSVNIGYQNAITQISFGYNVALGAGLTVAGDYSGAFGYNSTVNATGAYTFGQAAYAGVPNTINFGGIPAAQNTTHSTLAGWGDFSSNIPQLTDTGGVLWSSEIDLKTPGTFTLTMPGMPANFHLFVDEVGIVITQLNTLTVAPTVEFGYEGPVLNGFVVAGLTNLFTAAYQRQRYTTLTNYDGHTVLNFTVTVGAMATLLKGRVYFKGLGVQDQ